MRWNVKKQKLGVSRRPRRYIVRKRTIVAYGRELPTGGVK